MLMLLVYVKIHAYKYLCAAIIITIFVAQNTQRYTVKTIQREYVLQIVVLKLHGTHRLLELRYTPQVQCDLPLRYTSTYYSIVEIACLETFTAHHHRRSVINQTRTWRCCTVHCTVVPADNWCLKFINCLNITEDPYMR